MPVDPLPTAGMVELANELRPFGEKPIGSNAAYGQWMPQAWLDAFMKAFQEGRS